MKIVYYLPSLEAPGGLERIITFKANYLAEHVDGYEVIILTSEQRGTHPHFPLSERVRHMDLDVPFDMPYSQSRWGKLIKYPFRYYRFKQRFERTLKELRPDVTISTLRRELNFIHTLKDGSVKIGEFHTSRHFYHAGAIQGGNPLLKWIKKRLANSFVENLRRLKRVVVLTHEGALEWPELRHLIVLPNPITTPLTARTAVGKKGKRVISAGRLTKQKGYDLLLATWQRVKEQHPDWKLDIYGEGEDKTALCEKIKELQLEKEVCLHAPTSAIYDRYTESDFYVMSSRWEGFGLVLTEAMSCGIPCISFDCPHGPKDIIADGVDGILVENGNIEQLAEKINYLIEHEEVRLEMGRKAEENAKRYLPQQVMPQWTNLFESLTNK